MKMLPNGRTDFGRVGRSRVSDVSTPRIWSGILGPSPATVHVDLFGFSRIDFDRKIVRKAISKGALLVRREAKKMVARRGGTGRVYRIWGDMLYRASSPQSVPSMMTGLLQRSISIRNRTTVLAALIGPNAGRYSTRSRYAHFLSHGTVNMEPRPFMGEALDRRSGEVTRLLDNALNDALIPRPL